MVSRPSRPSSVIAHVKGDRQPDDGAEHQERGLGELAQGDREGGEDDDAAQEFRGGADANPIEPAAVRVVLSRER